MVRLSSDHAAAYEERATLMRIAWRIIGDHPLGGVGTGAYGLVMRNYIAVQDLGNWLFIVHNAYLLRWAESGIFGLLAFLSVLFVGFRLAFRCTRSVDDATFILDWGVGGSFTCAGRWWDIQLGGTTPLLFWFLLER
jgi:O-antigen ligase